MNKFQIACPVPLDQRPLNEYTSLKSSVFFFWTTKNTIPYFTQVFIISGSVYSIIGAILFSSVSIEEAENNSAIYTILLGSVVLLLIFIRFYLAWIYIYYRLLDATISYEESGWYDCQTWVKTPELLLQDTLTAQYELYPIINRLKKTILVLIGIIVFNVIYIKIFV
jgi:hypothetical protein